MTRYDDSNIGLAERARISQEMWAWAFISIHFNGDVSPSIQGTETFVYTGVPASSGSRKLAALVQREALQRTKYRDRGVREDKLAVLNPADHYPDVAACLVEISFITDPKDEIRLIDGASDGYRTQLAEAIAVAASDYCGKVP